MLKSPSSKPPRYPNQADRRSPSPPSPDKAAAEQVTTNLVVEDQAPPAVHQAAAEQVTTDLVAVDQTPPAVHQAAQPPQALSKSCSKTNINFFLPKKPPTPGPLLRSVSKDQTSPPHSSSKTDGVVAQVGVGSLTEAAQEKEIKSPRLP